MKIDLNCDMGEGVGSHETDCAIMRLISSVNIACGAHAGNEVEMMRCAQLAMDNNVAIGAHPGFADRKGFGRNFIALTENELRDTLYSQISRLKEIVEDLGGRLYHVKPHGAMYNHAANNYDYARVIARVIKEIDPKLILVGLAGSAMKSAAEDTGNCFAGEVFADRRYNHDGSLVARSESNAVIENTQECLAQVRQMIVDRSITSVSGTHLSIEPQTICVHGDTPDSVIFVKEIAGYLHSNDIVIRAINS